MPDTTYCQHLRQLSDQLIRLQAPIKILDAIKWPREIEQQFLLHDGAKMPAVDMGFYDNLPLPFDGPQLAAALKQLQRETRRKLGRQDPLGKILLRTMEQYLLVLELLQARGSKDFGNFSQRLYGSASHKLHGDRHSLKQLGDRLSHIFSLPAAVRSSRHHPKNIDAPSAVAMLAQRLEHYFHSDEIRVRLSDGIVSDAAVGGDTVKLNSRAMFSESDLKVYEVHEGWVHVGTTLNGRAQPWASWLSVGSPRVAATQEGLAVMMETLTLSSNPGRARRISDRITAVDMAENGADFVEVYRHFRQQQLSRKDSYRVTQRVFRGGMVQGGSCFTKDISYVRGYVENINFIRSAITTGVPELIPMLFVGKLAIEDIPILYQAQQQGIIAEAKYLPPMFANFSGLYAWFGFASGMMGVELKGVQRHFGRMFRHLPQTALPDQDETEFDNSAD